MTHMLGNDGFPSAPFSLQMLHHPIDPHAFVQWRVWI